jgi:hypothetical protein
MANPTSCPNCGYAAKRQNPDCGDHPTPMPDNRAKLEPIDYIANRHCNGVPGGVKYMISEEDWLAIKDEVQALINSEKQALLERLISQVYTQTVVAGGELFVPSKQVKEVINAELKTLRGGK